jgi:hypothetical protein
MSWRALILFLLLAFVASWQGGRQLGLWLVGQAPESIASAFNAKEDRNQVLDADGKPLAPQPPQPRIDGTLGVPKEMEPVEWTIAPVIASGEDANSYKKEGEEDEEGEDGDDQQDSEGNADSVRTVDVRAADARSQPVRPGATPSASLNWQDSLRKELAQCSKVGFFKRPSCIESAQNKYCGPNNAWGKVSECPDRGSSSNIGG